MILKILKNQINEDYSEKKQPLVEGTISWYFSNLLNLKEELVTGYHSTDANFKRFDINYTKGSCSCGIGFNFSLNKPEERTQKYLLKASIDLKNAITSTSKKIKMEQWDNLCKEIFNWDYPMSVASDDATDEENYILVSKLFASFPENQLRREFFLSKVREILKVDGLIDERRGVVVSFDPDNIHIEESNLKEDIEIHDTLNPLIWDGEKLKPEVEAKVREIVDKFKEAVEENEIKLEVADIYLVGSNANYNYNDESDLDIHIIADESFDCSEKHLQVIYQALKTLFNNKYDISFKGINVEVYVESKQDINVTASGIYSLDNGWIKKPSKYDIPEINQKAIDDELAKLTPEYEDLMGSGTIDEIDKFITKMYDLRIDSISKDGEFGTGNLVFKEFRRLGYLDDLKEKKAELESKEMSLESLSK